MKGRRIRKLEIERLMGRKAWTAAELCSSVHISSLNMRRYLRRYLRSGRLTRKKFGVIWYYAVERFRHEPNFAYPCPVCRGRMDVYKLPCGCKFQLCANNKMHDIWEYCEKHKGSIPRFERVEVQCHICRVKEVIRIDRKENKILAPWTFYGKMQLPGMEKKEEIWECEKCLKSQELTESMEDTTVVSPTVDSSLIANTEE